MSRLPLALAFVIACPALARADLNPEVNTPYRLEVVLGFSEHRLLTDVFKNQVERELQASLESAFGDLAEVKVLRDHARLQEVREKGLKQALESWKDLSEVKTHFVLIDYVNGRYEVQSRQHDGLTGQASPVVRQELTPHRQLVARTAALQVDQDFGLVGTLTDKGDQKNVRMTLRGVGRLKGASPEVPLERWVKKDDVFSLVQIKQRGEKQWAEPVEWAIAQVKDVDAKGVCDCRLFHRRKLSFGDATVKGWRCLHLHTTQTPLHLHLVQFDNPQLPQRDQVVQVRRHGFTEKETDLEEPVTNADGYLETRNRYANVAFVSVIDSKGSPVVQIPVPLVDAHTVVCPVRLTDDDELSSHRRCQFWLLRIYDSLAVQQDLFKELQVGKDRAKALETATAGLKSLNDDLRSFAEERNNLAKAAPAPELAKADDPIKKLEQARGKLQEFKEGLEKTIAEENDPKQRELQGKVAQAKLLEEDAEFDKAIALYEEVLGAGFKKAEPVREHLAELKKAWEVKNDAHRKARSFIYSTWPAADLARDPSAVADARKWFKVCQENGDKLAPQKLLLAAVAPAGKLAKNLAGLRPDVNEEDVKAAETLAKVDDDLHKLVKEVNDYLR